MKSRFERRCAVCLSALLLSIAARAEAQLDTIHTTRSLFTWRDGVLAGAFVAATIAIRPLDKSVATSMQDPNRQASWIYQKASTFVRTIAQPGSIVIGTSMYGIGRLTHTERLAEVGLHGTEALLIGASFADGLKYAFGRARPYVDTVPNPNNWQLFRGTRGNNYQSFPSGHTVAAFAAAAAVSAETSRWYPELTYFGIGPLMYGGATAVGLSRMYNNRHWASDVIMGAAIGTFAGTKVVRFHRTHPGNTIDKALLNVGWSPGHGITLGLVH
ncbi:MAG TPA: phosphatase PAP2 family protein [Gemmatimonadaceae bacterium]|nr:phosphatase PAP2 family protein [Gemmatimonadaceae bacterium]